MVEVFDPVVVVKVLVEDVKVGVMLVEVVEVVEFPLHVTVVLVTVVVMVVVDVDVVVEE